MACYLALRSRIFLASYAIITSTELVERNMGIYYNTLLIIVVLITLWYRSVAEAVSASRSLPPSCIAFSPLPLCHRRSLEKGSKVVGWKYCKTDKLCSFRSCSFTWCALLSSSSWVWPRSNKIIFLFQNPPPPPRSEFFQMTLTLITIFISLITLYYVRMYLLLTYVINNN